MNLEGLWPDLGRAVALMLVFEGLLPFLAPGRWRELMTRMAALDDRMLRSVGLLTMISGLAILQAL